MYHVLLCDSLLAAFLQKRTCAFNFRYVTFFVQVLVSESLDALLAFACANEYISAVVVLGANLDVSVFMRGRRF